MIIQKVSKEKFFRRSVSGFCFVCEEAIASKDIILYLILFLVN